MPPLLFLDLKPHNPRYVENPNEKLGDSRTQEQNMAPQTRWPGLIRD